MANALTCSELQDTEFKADRSTKSQVLLSAKEAVSLWVLGARKVGTSCQTAMLLVFDPFIYTLKL